MVLGGYSDAHDHPIGNANLPYVQIPKDTREYIAGLLRLKITPDHIVSFLSYLCISVNCNPVL
jgi:hypothetical protein